MCRTRFKKVFNDLWEKKNRSRSILVLIAITVGIVGLNLNSIVYSILDIELERSYLAANPASVSIVTDPIDDTIKTELRKLPQVKMLEARRKILGRLMIGPNNWKTIWLFVIEGFKNIRIDIIESEKGGWNPGKGEILIERKAFQVAKAEIGDTVTVLTKNGEKQQ